MRIALMCCLVICIHTIVMRELSDRTSKFIMWCVCLWINIFSQIISSFFLLYSYSILKSVNKKNEVRHRSPDSALIAPIRIATMRDATLQSIWIENGQNIARNNCLQVSKNLSWRLLINEKYDMSLVAVIHPLTSLLALPIPL